MKIYFSKKESNMGVDYLILFKKLLISSGLALSSRAFNSQ